MRPQNKEIRDLYDKAVVRAREIIDKIGDISHSLSHVVSVLGYAQEIASDYPETDLQALELGIWWHDVGRIDGGDGHDIRSAEMVKDEFTKLGLNKELIEKVYNAIVCHGNKSEKKPDTIEGKILKDADKLDFLTPDRWKLVIDNQKSRTIETAIRVIPSIRNHILSLPESKVMFDGLLQELKDYISGVEVEYFKNYRRQILAIKVLD